MKLSLPQEELPRKSKNFEQVDNKSITSNLSIELEKDNQISRISAKTSKEMDSQPRFIHFKRITIKQDPENRIEPESQDFDEEDSIDEREVTKTQNTINTINTIRKIGKSLNNTMFRSH